MVVSDDVLLKTKQILYNALRQLIHSTPFIDRYGRSNINPVFLTHYYMVVICNPEFVIEFIEKLPLKDIINNAENSNVFIKEIETLFINYVEVSQKTFESKIKLLLSILLDTKLVDIITLLKIKRFLFEAKNTNILTLDALIFNKKLRKMANAIISIIIDIYYIAVFLICG